MTDGDFSGQYKALWDSNYLYLLVHVIDDSLADYYTDPLSNWWNDDCVEVFIDEDRSKGYHECSYNAFAYHVSIYYDAIDMSTTCAGINLKNNMIVKMDTIGPHTYLWEFAIRIYNSSFNPSNPELSRVKLSKDKKMGFALAYCDYDGNANHERENFIGSIFMPQAHNNDNYKTADYLGEMILIDTSNQSQPSSLVLPNNDNLKKNDLFFNSSTKQLTVISKSDSEIVIYSPNGTQVYRTKINKTEQKINLNNLKPGIYYVQLFSTNSYITNSILIY